MESILPESDMKTSPAIYFLIIILPFLLLYWMMPFVTDTTLGADYQLFSINEQMEILFSIKTGSFPLYIPGYKYGHSSSALTLSQVYHPISQIASLLPGYWNGKALEWNTFLRLLTLGLTQLMLFLFLKKIRVNTLFSFLISLITVYNLRMLEAFRYGASLEAYTGTLLLCSLIGFYFISPSRWLGPLGIIGMTYLLICSGHPPMMFYGLLGVGAFTLVAPFFLAAMLPDMDIDIKTAFRLWVKVVAYLCLGILLSSAYVLPFYVEFVTKNIEYANIGYQAHMGQDTIVGAFNNFFMPLASDVLSTFGGSSLIIIPLLLPLLLFFKVKVPRSVLAMWGIWLFTFLFILGPKTPVFRWAWEYLPFVSSAGGPGRISIIVPTFSMMILSWIINAESISIRFKSFSVRWSPFTFLGLIALILIPLYLLPVFLLKPELGKFTPHFIRDIPFRIEFLSVLLAVFLLSLLVSYGIYLQRARLLGALLCLTVLLQLGLVLKYGTFIEKKVEKPSFEQLRVYKKDKIDFHFHQNPGLFHSVVLDHINRSFMEPFLGKIYTQVIPVSSQDGAYNKMERKRLPQQAYVEGIDLEKAKAITEAGKDFQGGTVNLIYSSFNRLEFRVMSAKPAVFGLSYPFTGHWKAWVNGEETVIYRANGVAHAVEIPEGESVIEFRYWSGAFFWGMVVSFSTFAIIGLFACFRGLKGMPGTIGAVVILILSAGGFMLWYGSLYSGDNLETEYTWSYTPPLKTPNLAYGKKMLSHYSHESSELRLHSNRVVDGDLRTGSGVKLGLSDEALIIDLNQMQAIETIQLYGVFKTQPEISLSGDNLQWQMVSFNISGNNKTTPLRLFFNKPKNERFIKVRAIDSELDIDELEVYGPE